MKILKDYDYRNIVGEDDNFEFDRHTALAVLKEFSRDMYPDYDLYGNKL